QPTLDLLATAIQRHPDVAISVVGHTSDRPLPTAYRKTFPSDLEWSEALAGALVHRFIDQFGCDPALFQIGGRGRYAPRAPNDSDATRDATLRVEIWMYPANVAPPAPE